MKVVVVIPTYNERESIEDLIEKLHTVAKKITRHVFSYVVVDDSSPDGTGEAVEKSKRRHRDVFLLTGKKQGLGRALLRGTLYAAGTLRGDIIVQMDADLSHDPAALPAFLAAIDKGTSFVVGSRYIPGGSIPANWAPHRKIFSVLGNAIVRLGLGYTHVHDWTGGYRAYRKEYVLAAQDEVSAYSGYVFQIAFLHRAILSGAQIVEVPIHFTDRRFGRSKIAPSQYIRDVLMYVTRARLQRVLRGRFPKFAVVGSVGFLVNTTVLEFVVGVGLHPTVGSALGAEIAIVSNFIFNNIWTFRSNKLAGNRIIGKFLQFNMTSVGAIVMQAGTVWIGTLFFGVATYRWFYLLGVGIGMVWNYTMYSRVIWKK